ncbi:hypothetical protein HK104_004576 [Borealophlyctis nickersoniae]|nr:hypothetical protein HK104_004576 [Borealophlyctis nickersoniae]
MPKPPVFRYSTDPKSGNPIIYTILGPKEILNTPALNKGAAFPTDERENLGLEGLLPDEIASLDEQVERAYSQYCAEKGNLEKNAFMQSMLDQNEVLYYRLLTTHMEEMLPIVYTPTEGEAIENYSHMFRRPRGSFLTLRNKGQIGRLLRDALPERTNLIVVTDSEEILGIGDQGVGGIFISVAKLALYTGLAGVNPLRVLPVVLDVGTDNEQLLNDKLYPGWRHKRVRGEEYFAFVDEFVQAVKTHAPGAMLHWEDFGRENARILLDKYQHQLCTFNDDMQGTGVITLAAVQAALKAIGSKIKDQRIVIFGAGTAGTGIADAIAYSDPSVSVEDARRQIWLVDKQGLLTWDMDDLTLYQKPYARPPNEIQDFLSTSNKPDKQSLNLLETIYLARPTILIGTSTRPSSFTEEIVDAMVKSGADRPIIFPLSNPTRLCEATPSDLLKWTHGRALVTTGSPFDPVDINGKRIVISEANNAFAYPGIGLGCIAVKATRCTEGMLRAAAGAIVDMVPDDAGDGLLPKISESRAVSFAVAVAVARAAKEEGVATVVEGKVEDVVKSIVWEPEYKPIVKVDTL